MNGLLEQLVEGSPFGILVVDTTGVLRVLNPCARRIVTTIGNPIGVQLVEAIPVADLHQMVPSEERQQVLQSEIVHGNSVLKVTSTALKNIRRKW